jgi:alpha-D-xyloside xylohydrolase
VKFTNGFWLVRDDVTMMRPAGVYDARIDEDSVQVYAPVKPITSRGDTLNTPVITVTFTAPRQDVIAVAIEHWAGAVPSTPRFELNPGEADVEIIRDDDADVIRFRSGRLEARIATSGPWQVDYLWDGTPLTSSTSRSIGYAQVDGEGPFVHEQLSLDVGEYVYGLGERFGAFVKNGQSVDIWNEDGGTSSEQAYKNVPFYLTSRGYGVLVDDAGRSPSRSAPRMSPQPSSPSPGQVAAYEVTAAGPRWRCCDRYTARTGRPAAGAGVVLRPVAVDLVHHRLRRGHGAVVRRRHGRTRHPAVRVPLRLLLDARLPLVGLHLGPGDLPGSRGLIRRSSTSAA